LNSSCNVDWFIILVKGNEKEISNKCPNMNLSDSNCRKKERKKERKKSLSSKFQTRFLGQAAFNLQFGAPHRRLKRVLYSIQTSLSHVHTFYHKISWKGQMSTLHVQIVKVKQTNEENNSPFVFLLDKFKEIVKVFFKYNL
jgi:hypothetical protein